MKYKITHNGKTFNTKFYDNEITDEEISNLRDELFKAPMIEQVEQQARKFLLNDGVKVNYIIDYFLRDAMNDAKNSYMKYTINEIISCDDYFRFLSAKIKGNKKFFGDMKYIQAIKTVMRLSPSGIAQLIPNFPMKTAIDIYKKYNINNVVYDYSCGWGIRALAATKLGIKYIGTDPNTELYKKLVEMLVFINEIKSVDFDISNNGSEIFNKKWENTVGLAFSSPPYFDLEIYSNEKTQSISDKTYDQWLREYWIKTVENIKCYLIDGGYFALNVKNLNQYQLLDDMTSIILKDGFTFLEDINMKVNVVSRPVLANNGKTSDEIIRIFQKTLK